MAVFRAGPGQPPISGIDVEAGNFLVVSGGSAISDTMDFGGQAYVSSGGTTTGIVLQNIGYEYVASGGTAIGTVVGVLGFESVSAGGSASNTQIEGGGNEEVTSGGNTVGTVVSNGGQEIVYSSGMTTGSVVENGAVETVYDGGTASNTVVSGAGGVQTVSSGGTASGAVIESGGEQQVNSGGSATSTTVSSGGFVLVASGGTVSGATIESGAALVVLPGGSAVQTTGAGASGVVVIQPGIGLVADSSVVSGSVLSAGMLEYVFAGGTAEATVVSQGGNAFLFTGGTASGSVVSNGGTEYVSSGAVANATGVNIGGFQYVSADGTASGTVVANGGEQVVYTGGSANGSVINSGGLVVVSVGGIASNAAINNSARLYVFSGGTAGNSQVASGGFEYAVSGATIDGITIDGGTAEIASGGVADQGTIAFALPGTLKIDAGAPASIVSGFGNGDTVDFTALLPGLVTVTPVGANTVIGGVTFAGHFPASGPGSLVIGPDSFLGTDVTTVNQPIVNQSTTLSIAGTSAAKAEGNSGSTPFTFTVTRKGVTAWPSSANWAVAGTGTTAANAADFTGDVLPSGTVNFAAGVSSQTITVDVAGDTTVEPNELFTVSLSGAAGAVIGTASSAVGTIFNDDTSLAIKGLSSVNFEGNSGSTPFTFTVSRNGLATGTSSATWSVAGSGTTPANAADFTGGVLPSGTVSFAAGAITQTITVEVAGDTTVEPNELFTVNLSNPVGATIATASAVGTIFNDDTAIAIKPLSATGFEGNSGTTPFTFTVTRSGLTTGITSANWAVTGSSAAPANAADFAGGVLPSGTVTFAAGATTETITVGVAGDTTVESNEGFTVTLSGATGASIATPSAVGTILNDDSALAIKGLSAVNYEGNSGTTPFTFTVSRSGLTTGASSAIWAVAGSGATPANAADFTGGVLPSGIVNFPAGATSETITVGVAGDTTVEPNELFTVSLSNPVGATIATPSAVGTIFNDDSALAIKGLSSAKNEGNSGTTPFTFTVTRMGLTTGTSSVDWAVAGSGTTPANAADFTGDVLPSGTINFAAGAITQTITVDVAGDTTVEPNELFTVSLSNAVGATISTPSAVGTIFNDDTALAIKALSATNLEGNSGTTPFTFTVSRSGLTTAASSANWAVTGSGVTPANAADFAGGVLPSGTVSFAAGQTSQTITVGVAGDTVVEPDEGFTVTLSGATGATITTPSANGTIVTDDPITSTAANATLTGTPGNDLFLIGGGNDIVTGNGGVDRFLFAQNALGPAATHTITMTDFTPALGEVLNLSSIDAIAGAPGDVPFTWIGSANFTGIAGQLRWSDLGTQRVIQGDINGDRTADLTILTNAPGSVNVKWLVL